MTYNAHEKGFMPAYGGLDDQPCLYLPIMTIIASALEDERELRKETDKRVRKVVEESKGGGDGPVSILHNPAYSKISTP